MAPAKTPAFTEARPKRSKPRKINSSPTLNGRGVDDDAGATLSNLRNEGESSGVQENPSQPELRPKKYQPLLPREEKMGTHHKGDTGDLIYFLRETGPVVKDSHRNSKGGPGTNRLVKRVLRTSQQITSGPASPNQDGDNLEYFKPTGTVQKTTLAGESNCDVRYFCRLCLPFVFRTQHRSYHCYAFSCREIRQHTMSATVSS